MEKAGDEVDLQVYIGFDARERLAWEVCAASIQAHAGDYPLSVHPIGRTGLEAEGLYQRPTLSSDGKLWDVISREFCSTDFSLARFWVPYVAGRTGWALYCDCDFLFRADVRGIMEHADARYAVMVVPNKHEPVETEKMNGQAQTAYFRKNWSSLMLWNLGHAGAHRPNLFDLNNWHKHDLHGFRWLAEMEIGFLPQEWNWLAGVSVPVTDPKAVHFTLGTPDMPGYEDSPYADEWRAYVRAEGKAA